MLYLFTDHGGRLNTNRENRPCSLCEKDFEFTQPMRGYCQHCSIDARRIASKPYRIFDRDWFSIDGRRMDGAASAASASSAASKVLIARLCIEDELKRQHRRLPHCTPFSTETKADRGNRRTWCKILLLFPRPISNGSSGAVVARLRSTASICCGPRPTFYNVLHE